MIEIRTEQISLFDDNKEYEDFVEKFKPKKTTDDCYTPPKVYDAVLDWARKEYGLGDREIVRPFYPDGDYEAYPYPDGCVVVDNPPFSIISKILEFYNARKIDYFLFAPALTLFSAAGERANAIVADCEITYENGAVVHTGFVTNMGDYKIHVSAKLHDLVADAMDSVMAAKRVVLPKYVYPDNVITAACIQKIASRGQELRIHAEDTAFIRALDAQRREKKAIFGDGFLLSAEATAEKVAAEKAAAEKAAAEKAAAIRWPLSDREIQIIKNLGK